MNSKRFLIRKPFNGKYIYKFKTSRKNPLSTRFYSFSFMPHYIKEYLQFILRINPTAEIFQLKYVSRVNKKSKPVFLPFSSLLPTCFDLHLEFFNFRVDRAALKVLYDRTRYIFWLPSRGRDQILLTISPVKNNHNIIKHTLLFTN